MTGKLENDRCYFCGGRLESKLATIPFVMDTNVVVIKQVPAHVCTQCGEAIMDSPVAHTVDSLLKQVHHLHSEVTILNYTESLPQAV